MENSKKKLEQQQIEEEETIESSTLQFFEGLGISLELPKISSNHDLISELLINLLKVDSISRGHVSCSFSVLPSVAAELNAVGSVVRSGRNLTVVSIEIRLKETKKLLYTAQATFHQLPAAKL